MTKLMLRVNYIYEKDPVSSSISINRKISTSGLGGDLGFLEGTMK